MDHALARRAVVVAITIAAVVALATSMLIARPATSRGLAVTRASDQGEQTAERNELRGDVRARAGEQRIFSRTGEVDNAPVAYMPGPRTWSGQQLFGPGNDWEPAIASDPTSGMTYVLTTRFNGLCNTCSHPSIMMRTSSDGGQTWDDTSYLCRGCDKWQYDPQIVVDDNGTVHATWLSDGWTTWYTQSTDDGATWAPRVSTKGSLNWTDHGFLTVSPDGQDVYVGMNKQDSYVAASHDGGTTFAEPVRTNPSDENLYYYHYEGVAMNSGGGGAPTVNSAGPAFGDVYISAAAVTRSPYARGLIRYFVLKSSDGGATWVQIPIDVVQEQPDCYTYGCRHDHWAGLASMSSDDLGNLVYTYVGARKAGKGQLTFVRTSADGGTTWTDPLRVSPIERNHRRVIAVFPAVVGTGNGDFRLIWMDNRNGPYRWNVWFSRSVDAGASWGPQERVSDAIAGAGYIHDGGFDSDYGDYLEVDINSYGETVAAWAAGFSYWGPGGTWMNVGDNSPS